MARSESGDPANRAGRWGLIFDDTVQEPLWQPAEGAGQRGICAPCSTYRATRLVITWTGLKFRPAPGLMHHSDQGSQYASHAFQAKLQEYGMRCSMSRKGNCWDNAPTESWFNSFKNERVHGMTYATHADMKATSFKYIEVFYNRQRQHSTLGYRSPRQFLDDWLSKQHQEKQVA